MAKIIITETFKEHYAELPKELQKSADKKIELLISNPQHPSLKIHNIKPTKFYEFYVNMKYRGIMLIPEKDVFELIAIGIHKIIDKYAKKK